MIHDDNRFRKIKNSILTRVVLFICVMIVIGGCIRYYFSYHLIHSHLFNIVSIHQEALAKEAAKEIVHDLDVRKQFLEKAVASIPLALLEDPTNLEKRLHDMHTFNPLFSAALVIIDPSGTLIAKSGTEYQTGERAYAQEAFFKSVLEDGKLIEIPFISPLSKKLIFPMSLPIKDETGKIRAFITGLTYYEGSDVFDRVLNGHIGQTGDFLLIDAKRHVFIAATQKALILKPTPSKGKNSLHDRAIEGFRGSGITVNTNGVEELSAVVSIPNTDWFVVSRIQTQEAFAMESNIQKTLIWAQSISLVVVPAILFAFLFFFFKPLRTSASLADKMSLGEVPLTPLPIARMDEVGYLTAAFNRLMSMLLASQKELKEIAHYDYLTKLPNRLLMLDRLERALLRCARNDTRLALLFMDLDGFKEINDTLGHDAGDQALVEVAKRFSALIRKSDTLARIGGDEFVILLCDLDSDVASASNAANFVATQCIEALKTPFVFKGNAKILGVSIGMALGDKASTLDAMMVEADTKMYQMKKKSSVD